MRDDYECLVIGGGPAGSTCGTILADYGHRVGLLEKSRFPRHHIGESLMPQTYWTFQRIGMLDKLKNSDFVSKESVQFISATGYESQPYYFPDRDPNEWSYTWQVKRDRFDRLMLDNAREHGVEVYEGVRVGEVVFEESRAMGVKAFIAGEPKTIRAKVVIDATGVNALLSRQLNIRDPDPGLKHAAVYAYWKNATRDTGRNHGATLVISTPDKSGWFWFIPLEDQITSIGVVAPTSYLITGRGDNPLATLEEEIEATPSIAKRIENAERVSQVYVTSDFSYRARRVAGDGWVLCGDAFCFLDPIYSSGVFFALKSAELTADAVHEAVEANDVSAARLGQHGKMLADGIHAMRQLVYAFYNKNFSFGQFNREHPELHNHVVRLLIGDVFNHDVDVVFDALREKIPLPERPCLEVCCG